MSTEREKYLRLKGELGSLESKVRGLESKARQIQADVGPAEHEALKLEISEDPQAKEQRAAIQKSTDWLAETSAQIEAGKKRLRATQELLPEFRANAARELKDISRRVFQKSLTVFAAKVRMAAIAEAELCEAQKQIAASYGEIDAPVDGIVERWAPTVMGGPNYLGVINPQPWEIFLEKLKALGFDVD
jgi:hypothetical protein